MSARVDDGATLRRGPLLAPAWVAGALLALVPFLLLAVALIAVAGGAAAAGGSTTVTSGANPSPLARREIPARYLELYERAAERYGLDWAVLAGIGKVECDHGRDPDPSCTQAGSVNTAGAGGPMQFLATTWARYGVDADGDGKRDRWDPADAIYAAANYLHASDAPGDYERAIFAYNHAGWYVTEVQTWAARYRGAPLSAAPVEAAQVGPDPTLATRTWTPVRFIAGSRAELAPGDGHLALIPAGVPTVVQAMVVAGNELQRLAYGPAGHPDPRGVAEEDCSSSINYVLYRAGVRPIGEIIARNPLAQDYVSWGAPGPGRWVSIYAADAPTPHAFVVIAGLRLDTSHNGTDVGPNRDEDGPRWRVLDEIPTWAHWSVRHPPGL